MLRVVVFSAHPARKWCRRVALLAGLAALPLGLSAADISRIEDLRLLRPEEAAKELTVHVHGVVTWTYRDQTIIQDGEAGVWLHTSEARAQGRWRRETANFRAFHVGDMLDVEGVTIAGAYAPGVVPTHIQFLGKQALPEAATMVPARFFSGADDALRVQVRGVVQRVEAGEFTWVLYLDANPGSFVAEFPRSALPEAATLVDAEVCLTGVAVTRFNTRGEPTLPRVFCSRRSELLIEKAAVPAFAAPLIPLDRIAPYRKYPLGPHRLRIRGTVIASLSDGVVFLQHDDAAVRVESDAAVVFERGDEVEASGFPDMSRYVGALTAAEMRKVGVAPVPEPLSATAEQLLRRNTEALSHGVKAVPHDFDGHVVRVPARLLAVQSPLGTHQPLRRIALQTGTLLVVASLMGGDPAALDRLRPGSDLEVTGIAQLHYTPIPGVRSGVSLMPTEVSLVLREAADVRVVRAASWWTASRLLTAVAVAVVALGVALVWVWELRRQVARKAAELADEIKARRDAAVEFQAALRERNRLAANLHDTLLQTLGGVGFEIAACEAEAAVPERQVHATRRLGVIRRILDVAVTELRNSVWSLRSLPLQSKSLPETLNIMMQRECAGRAVQTAFQVVGELPHISDFISGNLVLAAQEAVRNAIKHGRPAKITMELAGAHHGERVQLTVRDDGCGFDPANAQGASQGHFGLLGMRERIERLSGSVTLTSRAGAGTVVQLDVPLRQYDEVISSA